MTLTAIGTNTDSLVGVYQLDMTAAVNVFTDPTIAGETYYFKASGTWSGAGSCENRDPFYYFMNGCQPVNNYATSWKFNGAKPPKPMPLQYCIKWMEWLPISNNCTSESQATNFPIAGHRSRNSFKLVRNP